jgi:predicted GH43/DUF377 family glycosyl hydrolase
MLPIPVTKTAALFVPDPTRVITKPFAPGGGDPVHGHARVERILARILALPKSEVTKTLSTTRRRFTQRHRDLDTILDENFAAVAAYIPQAHKLSAQRRQLIGAYFSHEYSIEAAALSNPSIVAAPNQDELGAGEQRFIVSLRAIGEGHISSIQFRSGVIAADGHIVIEAPSRYASTAHHHAPVYDNTIFRAKMLELCTNSDLAMAVLDSLPDRFTIEQLDSFTQEFTQQQGDRAGAAEAMRALHWLASSNYESSFAPESKLSERILFPEGPTESHGMEDARFVRFTYDDGSSTYFATYTAYDGYRVMPQLIQTDDFVSFRIATLNGPSAKNKGIALFPRMIDGRYAALSRIDNENNFLMWSDNVHFWYQSELLQTPSCPWEITQIGNCGSPLETEAGWLVITHGVGAFRQYALGAILLDKDDPARVIGHLNEPLLEPSNDERDGYVPNVAYSCGSMISGQFLVLPYGFSDVGARIATVRLDDLLSELTADR